MQTCHIYCYYYDVSIIHSCNYVCLYFCIYLFKQANHISDILKKEFYSDVICVQFLLIITTNVHVHT